MSMRRFGAAAILAAAVVLAVVGLAVAASGDKYKASLTAAQEVPKPKGVPSGAAGSFKAAESERNGKKKLTWRLTFHGLSGKATAAHIHLGKRGKAGPVVVPLCGPCTSGAHGTATISNSLDKSIEGGKAYVNVHTIKNPNGEIRGQVKPLG